MCRGSDHSEAVDSGHEKSEDGVRNQRGRRRDTVDYIAHHKEISDGESRSTVDRVQGWSSRSHCPPWSMHGQLTTNSPKREDFALPSEIDKGETQPVYKRES